MGQEVLTDTIHSKGKLYLWKVTRTGGEHGEWLVRADSASHAIQYIVRTVWVAATSLTAQLAD